VGSVDNEHTFPAVNFVKNDQRNSLESKHVNTCGLTQVFRCFRSNLLRWSFLTNFIAKTLRSLSTLPTGTSSIV